MYTLSLLFRQKVQAKAAAFVTPVEPHSLQRHLQQAHRNCLPLGVCSPGAATTLPQCAAITLPTQTPARAYSDGNTTPASAEEWRTSAVSQGHLLPL
jgi:hypothetical protein